jgi:hypothetical protein
MEDVDMKNKSVFSKILAIAGTLLSWLPILAPVIFSLILLAYDHVFLFDYLMPAEAFPIALAGGVLLLWAAFRAHSRQKLIGWGLVSAVVFLVGVQAIAEVTGLASGRTEAAGLPWVLVLSSLALYSLALVIVAVGGVLLLRDLFKPA